MNFNLMLIVKNQWASLRIIILSSLNSPASADYIPASEFGYQSHLNLWDLL